MTRTACALVLLLASTLSWAGPTPPTYKFGDFPYYPRIIGIPQDDYIDRILPGWLERAQANTELARDLYGQQKILKDFPAWKKILEEHPGFWPELVGKLGDTHSLRMYGPDVWALQDGRYVVGEENGANVGGNEAMRGVVNEFKKNPKWGAVPYNDDFFQRMGDEIRRTTGAKTIVYADEGSLRTESIIASNGKEVHPPFSLNPEFHKLIVDGLAQAGIQWVSLIDDRGRVLIEDGIPYLKSADGQSRTRIDALITAADLESIDPNHKPQWERNIRVHRGDLNDAALAFGVPGLVKAWVEQKNGGFTWVNNPTSTLSRSKLWPVMIDQFIQKKTGRAPLLPVQKTITFFDEQGNVDNVALNHVLQNNQSYVLKMALGDGGKQVWIEKEITPEILKQFESWARTNPFSVLAQPLATLQQMELTWPHAPEKKENRVFDIRQLGLIGEQPVINRHLLCRLARTGSKKVNVSGGGALSIGIPADVETVRPLAAIPLIGAREVGFPHTLSAKNYDKLLRDSANRAMVEAMLLRDLYMNPEAIFKKFPILEKLVTDSVYFRPDHFKNSKNPSNDRSLKYPMLHISGPDYIENEQSEYLALEHNTTNIGGMFRLWRMGITSVNREIHDWIRHMQALDQSERPFLVYYLEETELGAPWQELRKKFKKQFGVELASASERDNFFVQSDKNKEDYNKLFYHDSTGSLRQVTAMVTHIEPDFIDSEIMSDLMMNQSLGEEKTRELRKHEIKGIARVIKAGNILVINEPGQDISCCKSLLPLMPLLQRHYLGLEREIVPTITSENFIDSNGALREGLLAQVTANPSRFVIKNGELTGGGGGVFILREESQEEVAKILDHVRKNPAQFILQNAIEPKINPAGFHAEVRIVSLVEVDLNSNAPAKIVGQIPVPYARGANGMNRVNILPTGGAQPGYRVPIRCELNLTAKQDQQ